VAIDIVRVPPSRLNTLASQAAQTLISPASQVSRSQNRKTGVQLKRIIWGLPRSAQNPNPATPGGERCGLLTTTNEHLGFPWVTIVVMSASRCLCQTTKNKYEQATLAEGLYEHEL
jgi:hypothetical protein